ncbi:Uncharacterised protein [Yersinia aldovae]|nr:Uncharacterised protein [Yersinia aldovae]
MRRPHRANHQRAGGVVIRQHLLNAHHFIQHIDDGFAVIHLQPLHRRVFHSRIDHRHTKGRSQLCGYLDKRAAGKLGYQRGTVDQVFCFTATDNAHRHRTGVIAYRRGIDITGNHQVSADQHGH